MCDKRDVFQPHVSQFLTPSFSLPFPRPVAISVAKKNKSAEKKKLLIFPTFVVMSSHRFPEMHYITEPERAQHYPAVVRISSIPSVPSTFPFKVPVSPPTARGPRYTIGWMEFQSPYQPDSDVARPGDIWIQLPLGHRKARVYACYARDGKDWSPWVGNGTTIGDRTLVRTHPFLDSEHAQRRFYLVFNGREFTWANIKAISNIQHNHPHVARMGPTEAVAMWLEVSGKRASGSRKAAKQEHDPEEDVHTVSAPPPTRKHPRSEPNGAVAVSASAPPTKKLKNAPRDHPPSPSERSPLVRSGPYAKAGATQVGWLMYVDGVQLKMPTLCTNCAKDKTPCSGLPGQRCGRCRFKKRWCSHSNALRLSQAPTPRKESVEEDEAAEHSKSTPSLAKGKSASRSAAHKLRTPTKPKAATKNPRTGAVSRPQYSAFFSLSVRVNVRMLM
jgi:hypothetical protein